MSHALRWPITYHAEYPERDLETMIHKSPVHVILHIPKTQNIASYVQIFSSCKRGYLERAALGTGQMPQLLTLIILIGACDRL